VLLLLLYLSLLSLLFSFLLATNWTQKETVLLWNLCRQFNMNFPLVHDRLNWQLQLRSPKTLEEVKERFCELNRHLNQSDFVYDKDLDLQRRLILESYHSRPVDQSIEEAFVVDYLEGLERSGQLANRLAERIETIKMLAGEQFTAGWPTLPELLKIAAGKGVARLVDKSDKQQQKKKKKKKTNSNSNTNNNPNSNNNQQTNTKSSNTPSSQSSAKRTKTATGSSSGNAGNIYLSSTKVNPLRVGSARAVEKILADFNLPLKPNLPTPAVIHKYDQLRAAIIRLIDTRKAVGLPPSKPLDTNG
jgi:hypothetical protein